MKKILIVTLAACIVIMAVACAAGQEKETDSNNSKELDFTKVDKLSFCFGNDELFTEDEEIIGKMFPKDCVYTKRKDDIPEFAGCGLFNAYAGKKLLYEIRTIGDELGEEYVYINGELYVLENPPDYMEISDRIQEENKD